MSKDSPMANSEDGSSDTDYDSDNTMLPVCRKGQDHSTSKSLHANDNSIRPTGNSLQQELDKEQEAVGEASKVNMPSVLTSMPNNASGLSSQRFTLNAMQRSSQFILPNAKQLTFTASPLDGEEIPPVIQVPDVLQIWRYAKDSSKIISKVRFWKMDHKEFQYGINCIGGYAITEIDLSSDLLQELGPLATFCILVEGILKIKSLKEMMLKYEKLKKLDINWISNDALPVLMSLCCQLRYDKNSPKLRMLHEDIYKKLTEVSFFGEDNEFAVRRMDTFVQTELTEMIMNFEPQANAILFDDSISSAERQTTWLGMGLEFLRSLRNDITSSAYDIVVEFAREFEIRTTHMITAIIEGKKRKVNIHHTFLPDGFKYETSGTIQEVKCTYLDVRNLITKIYKGAEPNYDFDAATPGLVNLLKALGVQNPCGFLIANHVDIMLVISKSNVVNMLHLFLDSGHEKGLDNLAMRFLEFWPMTHAHHTFKHLSAHHFRTFFGRKAMSLPMYSKYKLCEDWAYYQSGTTITYGVEKTVNENVRNKFLEVYSILNLKLLREHLDAIAQDGLVPHLDTLSVHQSHEDDDGSEEDVTSDVDIMSRKRKRTTPEANHPPKKDSVK